MSAAPDEGDLGPSLVLDLEPDRVAHGGSCLGRAPDGRVVFVRHALPGERVRVRLTEERAHYLRADAVEVLRAAPDRVTPRCPYAGPGRCGGCDWQHAGLAAQRRFKAQVVGEQLHRLAGVETGVGTALELEVRAVPGRPDGLGWRTRVRFAVDEAGRVGFHRHRSEEIEPVDSCAIADPRIHPTGVTRRRWPGRRSIEVAVGTTGSPLVRVDGRRTRGRGAVDEQAAGRSWRVSAGSFWQVHPGAADTLVAAVRDLLRPQPGERLLDLYSGVGLFAGALAGDVGPRGRVLAIEGRGSAVRDAEHNLADLPQVEVRRARVDPAALAAAGPADLVVLDPPRSGAGAAVVAAIAGCRPRSVAYLACDPAPLARDVAAFAEHGYRPWAVRGFDLFPMTAQVECLVGLEPVGRDADWSA